MEAMKQTYFRRPAYESFDKKFSKRYSITLIIIKAFFTALCLSAFIYLDYFELNIKFINSLFAFFGIYHFIQLSKKELFFTGFFIGILWFYWISFSFIYYELPYLIPFVILGVGLIYGLVFLALGFLSLDTMLLKAGLFVLLSFVEIFEFNWFKPELMMVDTYFTSDFYLFCAFVLCVYLFVILKKQYKLLPLLALFALSFLPLHVEKKDAPIDIKISEIYIKQDVKWDKKYKREVINYNLSLIHQAISEQRELVILPESAFPTYLNLDLPLMDELQNLSHKIVIFTGALSVQNNRILNSSYLFKEGEVEIAHKYILVPFGESIPLPKFARDLINKLFFNGAEDYESAKAPHDFVINGIKFRNAICFEATKDALFEGNPRYMIAISNNAWFSPSIEPTLQNLLLKYYARKYNTTIYHSANGGLSGIIH